MIRHHDVEPAGDGELLLVAMHLEPELAERVLADAAERDVPPGDVMADALREHYARLDGEV